jgi:hypothetical protein
MPPRRGRQSPNPEGERELSRRREMSRERSSHGQNVEMERELRNLRARMEDMEAAQRRRANTGDLSDSEGEEKLYTREVTAEDASTERLIKAIARMSSKTKMDIPAYEEAWMQKSCWIGSELLTPTSITRISKRIRR